MDAIVLEAEKRTRMGKKVKALRREGITPANIFGHNVNSLAIQVNTLEAEKILAKAGATQMIMIKGPSFKKSRRVLTKGVARDPLNGKLIHIDFHQVSLKDKVKVEVPLIFEGEAPASRSKDLVVLENLRSVEVECLPTDIPANIAIDISNLEEAGDSILVSDLDLDANVTVLTNAEDVLIKVDVAKVAVEAEEVEEEIEGKEEEEAAAEEAPQAEAAESPAGETTE